MAQVPGTLRINTKWVTGVVPLAVLVCYPARTAGKSRNTYTGTRHISRGCLSKNATTGGVLERGDNTIQYQLAHRLLLMIARAKAYGLLLVLSCSVIDTGRRCLFGSKSNVLLSLL
jgi:hypothetical protein